MNSGRPTSGTAHRFHTVSQFHQFGKIGEIVVSLHLQVPVWKTPKMVKSRLAGDRIEVNISIKRRVGERVNHPTVEAVEAAGEERCSFFNLTLSACSSWTYISLFPFHLIFLCSTELFTLSSNSVSLPYLFLNLWAAVQTLADLYLNVSSTLSGSHYSRAAGSALYISFQNFSPCTCGQTQPFSAANY